MSVDNKGANWVFLISLPRSGSTMLQKILACNPDIHTTSEPWIMLHPIYALREQNCTNEYNTQWAYQATKIFLSNTPGGEDTYYEGLRLMFSHIYETVLKPSEKKYFLDKTPRYYEIILELYKVFPNSKFIILLRNPLAILNSRIDLLPDSKNLHGLELYNGDLLSGPSKLLRGIEALNGRCFVLKYEDLVLHPEVEIKNLCEYLETGYSGDMLEYNKGDSKAFDFGDPVTVYENRKPNVQYRERWLKSLADPQLWRLFSEYHEFLGDEIVNSLGYSSSRIRNQLNVAMPGKLRLLFTRPMGSFLKLSD